MPSSIDTKTKSFEELCSVARWFKGAKVEKKDDVGNVLRCVDKERFTKWRPFLEEMNLHKEVSPQYSLSLKIANVPRATVMLFCEYWDQ